MESLVSIIIPIYNTERYLEQCIESVVRQSYNKLEIILINDGSTDHSADICLQWAGKDERIIYISKKNEGLGAARNFGIAASTGKYFIFLDSDDWLDKECILGLYLCMIENDSDICFSDYAEFDNQTSTKRPMISETDIQGDLNTKNLDDIILGQHCIMCGKMYKKTLFLENKIIIPNIIHEDTAIYPTLVMLARTVSYYKKVAYYYRVNRQGSIVTSVTNQRYVISAMETCVDILKRNQLMGKCNKAVLRYVLGIRGMLIHKYGRCTEMDIFLDDNFVGWRNFRNERTMLLGGFAARWCIQRWLTDSSKMGEHQCFASLISLMSDEKPDVGGICNTNPFRMELLNKEQRREMFCLDEEISRRCDYLFIDFMEERFDIGEIADGNYITLSDAFMESSRKREFSCRVIKSGSEEFKELWEKACLKLIERLKIQWKPDNVILLEARLSEQYGVYQGEQYFEELERIRDINRMLERFEAFFEEQFKGIRVIKSTAHKALQYTCSGEQYGCYPWYKNRIYYRQVSNMIECSIGDDARITDYSVLGSAIVPIYNVEQFID